MKIARSTKERIGLWTPFVTCAACLILVAAIPNLLVSGVICGVLCIVNGVIVVRCVKP